MNDVEDEHDILGEATRHVYKTAPQGELPLYVYTGSPGGGAVVFFFGGGWVGGNLAQFAPQAKRLAGLGLTACLADYRVESRHGTTLFEAVEDGRDAVRWLRDNAAVLAIDSTRLAVSGGSAGGHIAACAAVLASEDDPTPAAMVLFNPVLDTSEAGVGADRIGPRAEELSPLHHVRAGLPPALILHGTGDKTVPFEQARRFTDAMETAGNACKLVRFANRPHGFFNYGRADYERGFAEMERFLRERGLLG